MTLDSMELSATDWSKTLWATGKHFPLMKWQVLFNSRNNLIGRSRSFMRYTNICSVIFEKALLLLRARIVVTDCGLNDQDSITGKGRDFSFCHHIQTGCEAHTTSYPVGTCSSLSWDKEARKWSLPLPSSAQVKNVLESTPWLHGMVLNQASLPYYCCYGRLMIPIDVNMWCHHSYSWDFNWWERKQWKRHDNYSTIKSVNDNEHSHWDTISSSEGMGYFNLKVSPF